MSFEDGATLRLKPHFFMGVSKVAMSHLKLGFTPDSEELWQKCTKSVTKKSEEHKRLRIASSPVFTTVGLVCFEAIADAPDGLDFFAKRAQFFAQARHVIVYRTIEAIIAVSPDLLQEYFTFEDPARM